ncbi:glycosyltransferase family 1 protein [Pelagibius sp. CAU 1746]|uniref:glycosyltransferase family 4 protein n=1 Tax=Pelagibius sp. CAU 1746 TaxID=3140370 RepID=UPI00325B8BA4
MKILLASDAWHPQINGVVRTLNRVREELEARGHSFEVICPGQFRTFPCPSYPEIRLAVLPGIGMAKRIEALGADAIHIATEGPIGLAVRNYCVKRGLPFTTSYHTRFPEYLSARLPLPVSWGYAFMRWFHKPSRATMVATDSMKRELEAEGFRNLADWTRGVDTALFRPAAPKALDGLNLPRPVHLYVGRVAVEKNIRAFLELPLPGSKVVVGDGPQRAELQAAFPEVYFAGAQQGEELAAHYASGDVFVFPSRTDTFGLVMLEALASGLPVAAYPVPGPLDIVDGAGVGALNEDLRMAVDEAIKQPRSACRSHALRYSWAACAEMFLQNLSPLR